MKKSKFLILGSVASLSAIPFVAAKCDTTDSSPTINKEDEKNNNDDTKNNPDININTNIDSGSLDSGQGGGSISSENSQATPGSREESNHAETTPNDANTDSTNSEEIMNEEVMTPMNDGTEPSESPAEPDTPIAPESFERTETTENSNSSNQGENATSGSRTEETMSESGKGTDRTEQPMADAPDSSNNSNGSTATSQTEPEKRLELLYNFFNSFEKIDEKIKDKPAITELNNKFHSVYTETIKKFDSKADKELLKKLGYDDNDLNNLFDIFDDISNLTSARELEKDKKKFIELFEKVKTKLTGAYKKYKPAK
ncbi:Hypothetical protein, predicted lipoprotein [Mycoplasmopsis agalactiae 14628]|uniref:Variable surface lipoprotein n=1 Tax=Mycoplasmopsis agalactiae 14628 TaxID=1110504 RepID=I5D6R3_MYCAA|nr:variable surface lipoprotein [Mycoplasmopsis agalactiae]EIN15372.1 Hypothetical protein, predicted lipoprotein [Mycoplasmopsis agalactiae 14628]